MRPRVLVRGDVRERDHARPLRSETRLSVDLGEPVAPKTLALGSIRDGVDDIDDRLRRELGRQQRHCQERAAARVWVGVERRVDTALGESVELAEHDVRLGVKVRDMHADAGRAGDLRDLVDPLRRVRLVPAAHVADVDPAGRGDRFAERRDLVRGGEDAGNVVEPGRQADSPVAHPLCDELGHRRALVLGRGGRRAPADLPAHGSGGHEVRRVEARGAVSVGEELGDASPGVGGVRPIDGGEVLAAVGAVAGGV